MVTNLNDSGLGSLRQAILDSDSPSNPGPNEIDIASGLSGTITLTTGQLTINTNAVTIKGPGSGVLTVSGNNAGRVFEVDGVSATIGGLTITGGAVVGATGEFRSGGGWAYGGGIYVAGGGLTLTGQARVVGNSVIGGQGGPGGSFFMPHSGGP